MAEESTTRAQTNITWKGDSKATFQAAFEAWAQDQPKGAGMGDYILSLIKASHAAGEAADVDTRIAELGITEIIQMHRRRAKADADMLIQIAHLLGEAKEKAEGEVAAELAALRKIADKATERADRAEATAQEMKAQVEEARKEAAAQDAQAKAEIAKAREAEIEAKKSLLEMDRRATEIAAERDLAKGDITAMGHQLETAQRRIAALGDDLKKLEGDKEQLTAKLDEAKEARDEAKADVKGLSMQLATMHEHHQAEIKEKKEAKAALEAATSRIARLEAELAAMTDRAQRAEKRAEETDERAAKAREEAAAAKARIEEIEKKARKQEPEESKKA